MPIYIVLGIDVADEGKKHIFHRSMTTPLNANIRN